MQKDGKKRGKKNSRLIVVSKQRYYKRTSTEILSVNFLQHERRLMLLVLVASKCFVKLVDKISLIKDTTGCEFR